MARRVRQYAWSNTALGDPIHWSVSLQTLLGVMLASRQATFLIWGPDRVWFYNDAFIPILGRKHPAAMGQHGLDQDWAEARDTLGPAFERVFAGEGVEMDDLAISLDHTGQPEQARFRFSYTPVRDASGGVLGLFGTCTETTALVELEASNSLLRRLMESVPGVVYAKDREGRFLAGNAGTSELLGKRYEDFIGRTDLEVLEDKAEAAALMANDRRIMETGIAEQLEEQVTFPDGTTALWLSTKAPLRDQDDRILGLIGSSVDVTDRRRAEEQRSLLVHELNHRVKNTLAVVQAMARQTFRDPTPTEQLERFDARIAALSRAHTLLIDTDWTSASLRQVINEQLGIERWGTRLLVEGPDVPLSSRVAVNLALILHELCTNATKYGAFSNDTGRVEITWQAVTERGLVSLRWIEIDGPRVVVPERRGFGSRMIERALAAEKGRVRLDFLPAGLVCEIEAPITA
ncbi:PAS domain-containing protein [uncultured Phenylobacterium sp.]|uniref:sensor histidine kinase n=1 Tax=uncultured Phenylobacterium sp. TaxID=349273 RepID=UPI0025FD76F0|nr:PAS domain-containing protein [uncultured Phenylobacterium sp.]